MAQRRVFLDTSFVIALENRADVHHVRAKTLDDQLLAENAELVLHWGILLEIGDGYSRLGRRHRGLQYLEKFQTEEGYRIHSIDDQLLWRGLELYRSRTDKEWGMTDCLSFVLMEREGIADALTADIHFRQAGFKALLLDHS